MNTIVDKTNYFKIIGLILISLMVVSCVDTHSNKLANSNLVILVDLSVLTEEINRKTDIEVVIKFTNPTTRAICIPTHYLPGFSLDKGAYYSLNKSVNSTRVLYNGNVEHQYGALFSSRVQILLPNEELVFSENIEDDYDIKKNIQYKIRYLTGAYYCDELNVAYKNILLLKKNITYKSKYIKFTG